MSQERERERNKWVEDDFACPSRRRRGKYLHANIYMTDWVWAVGCHVYLGRGEDVLLWKFVIGVRRAC